MEFEQIRLLVEIVVGALITPLAIVLWWNFRSLKSQADATQKELIDFKLHVATTHPTQDQLSKAIDGMTQAIREVFGQLNSIRTEIREMSETFRDKLDGKADRSHP